MSFLVHKYSFLSLLQTFPQKMSNVCKTPISNLMAQIKHFHFISPNPSVTIATAIMLCCLYCTIFSFFFVVDILHHYPLLLHHSEKFCARVLNIRTWMWIAKIISFLSFLVRKESFLSLFTDHRLFPPEMSNFCKTHISTLMARNQTFPFYLSAIHGTIFSFFFSCLRDLHHHSLLKTVSLHGVMLVLQQKEIVSYISI